MISPTAFKPDRLIAIDYLGAEITWDNARSEARQLATAESRAHAGWLVCSTDDKWRCLFYLLAAMIYEKKVIFCGSTFSNFSTLEANLKAVETNRQHGIAFLTSGTTGSPKAVFHTAASLTASALSMAASQQLDRPRIHHLFPATYMAGVLNCMVLPLVTDGLICMDDRFNHVTPLRINRSIERMQSNASWLSPRMIAVLSRFLSRDESAGPLGANWKLVLSATGPLLEQDRGQFCALSGVPIHNTYGTTEHMFISSERQMDAEISCGYPVEGVNVRVTSPSLNESGHIEVRSATSALSVLTISDFGRSQLQSPTEMWTPTGDSGRLSKRRLFVEGRIDDVLVLGGLNVSAQEICNASLLVDGVLDAWCFAEEDDAGHLQLLVALETGRKATENGISEAVRGRIRSTFPPEVNPRWIVQLESFPRTLSGKVDRRSLRRRVRIGDGSI